MKMNLSLAKVIFITYAFTNSSDAKIGTEQRAHIVRQMTAEYGTARVIIPRSKKALNVSATGRYDETEWNAAMGEFGPAARLGDLVQITDVKFKKTHLILVLNHGIKGGRKWWHRIQIHGTTRQRTSLGTNQRVHAPGGTKIALNFGNKISALGTSTIKQILTPLIDFTQRSATELYMEKLPEEFKEAIVDKYVIEGMNRKMVLLAMGRPDRKIRDFENSIETEDWIYGTPPGNLTFVTFKDEAVINVLDTYAAPGGTVGIAHPPQDKE
jgi:hypothetical protein